MLKDTREAANEKQHYFTPKDLLQKIFSLGHVEIQWDNNNNNELYFA